MFPIALLTWLCYNSSLICFLCCLMPLLPQILVMGSCREHTVLTHSLPVFIIRMSRVWIASESILTVSRMTSDSEQLLRNPPGAAVPAAVLIKVVFHTRRVSIKESPFLPHLKKLCWITYLFLKNPRPAGWPALCGTGNSRDDYMWSLPSEAYALPGGAWQYHVLKCCFSWKSSPKAPQDCSANKLGTERTSWGKWFCTLGWIRLEVASWWKLEEVETPSWTRAELSQANFPVFPSSVWVI